MVRACVLSSGSGGNCLWIEGGGFRVLVDAGLSLRDTARRCAQVGLDLRELTDLVLTHEHADHSCAAGSISRKLGVRVHATSATHRALRDPPPEELCFTLAPGRPLRFANAGPLQAGVRIAAVDLEAEERSPILAPSFPAAPGGARIARPAAPADAPGLWVSPLAIPHDAADPVAYVFEERNEAGSVRCAVVTDLGCAPAALAAALSGTDLLVLEMNHDLRMLLDGPYPFHLKRRIRSDVGHLSNDQGAALLSEALRGDRGRLRHLVLAHLSEHNNTEARARRAAEAALRGARGHVSLSVAGQAAPLPPFLLAPRAPSPPRTLQLSLFPP